jgi:hypothetical protein
MCIKMSHHGIDNRRLKRLKVASKERDQDVPFHRGQELRFWRVSSDLKLAVEEGKNERKISMKKLCVLASLAGVMAAPSLFATMQVTLYQDTSSYSYGSGGEFRAVGNKDLNNVVNWSAYSGNTASSGSYFQTFCIEDTEFFSPGTRYDAAISDNALYGHAGASPGVPVTMGTAWLYSQFAAGTLSGYTYTYGGGRTEDAGSLQEAIWYFQGENNNVSSVTNKWVTLANEKVAGAFDAADGAFGVEALNLGAPGAVQDQLVIVPEPTTMLAGALLLLPFGVSTLRILRKRVAA